MTENEERRSVDRRRLLRRAGTVAAAVAGAGAVAAIAGPADAADGQNLIIGANNTGTATTKLTAGGAATPSLRLENTTGSPLSVRPLATTVPNVNDPSTWSTQPASTQAPVGSLYVDDWGDVAAIGQPGAGALGPKYVNPLYSPTWATMVVPITPLRYFDSRSMRQHVVPGSAKYDSKGRVLPKNSYQIPDLVLDLSPLFSGGYGAVQANLSVLLPLATGYGSLWDTGDFPVTASILYSPVLPELSNFTQTLIGPDQTIRLKTSVAAQYVIDIVGFVCADPFRQLATGSTATAVQGASAPSFARWHKRAPDA